MVAAYVHDALTSVFSFDSSIWVKLHSLKEVFDNSLCLFFVGTTVDSIFHLVGAKQGT